MQTSNPLDALPPLAMPADISWWPLAIGWWILIIIFSLALISLFIVIRQYWRAGNVKRLALKELEAIYQQYLMPLKPEENMTNKHYRYLHDSTQLLRKFCIQHFNSQTLATAVSKNWLAELDTMVKKPCLNSTVGEQLLSIYEPKVKVSNADTLNKALERWFRQAPIKPKLSFKIPALKKIKVKEQRPVQ